LELSNKISSLNYSIVFVRALSSARAGKYNEARALLEGLIADGYKSPEIFDLLAKISAQCGDFDNAKRWWEKALELSPDNETYRAGIERISNIKKFPYGLQNLNIPLIVLMIVLVLLFIVGIDNRKQISRLSKSIETESAHVSTLLERANKFVKLSERYESSSLYRGVEKSLLSATVLYDFKKSRLSNMDSLPTVLVYEGLFFKGTMLTFLGEKMLIELGRKLKPYAGKVYIRVVGYTDNIPVREGSWYKDNLDLGMARAYCVARKLSMIADIPLNGFCLETSGEYNSPFPNDSKSNRLRNRTAIVYIYEKR